MFRVRDPRAETFSSHLFVFPSLLAPFRSRFHSHTRWNTHTPHCPPRSFSHTHTHTSVLWRNTFSMAVRLQQPMSRLPPEDSTGQLFHHGVRGFNIWPEHNPMKNLIYKYNPNIVQIHHVLRIFERLFKKHTTLTRNRSQIRWRRNAYEIVKKTSLPHN